MIDVVKFIGRYLKGWQIALSGVVSGTIFLGMTGVFIIINASEDYNTERLDEALLTIPSTTESEDISNEE